MPEASDWRDDTLIRDAVANDETALAELFDRYSKRLRKMVLSRLDPRLQGRVDPSDVLQEAYLNVTKQLPSYIANRKMPFFLWLRLVVGQTMMVLHRAHFGAAMRDAGREVSLQHGAGPKASSASLAAQLMGHFTTASQAAIRAETRLRLETALNGMDSIDREILALRHFEELTNIEAAITLGLDPSAASKRYMRALARLQEVLRNVSGLLDRES